MKSKKIGIIIFTMISIINIIFTITGYIIIEHLKKPFNYDKSYSNNIIFTILVLLIQSIAIILLLKEWKRPLNNEVNKVKFKRKLIIIIILIVITFFVPVKKIYSIEEKYDENLLFGIGTTTTEKYQNIYSITIWKNESTVEGVVTNID